MAEELSLVINSPGEGEMLREITWNKEEFMELVASLTEQYEGLVYTEEQMKSAKEDRAKLNAMKKAISDRRIEVKKMFTAPLDKFEQEVKEVVALIEKPVQMIDQQIKEYEEAAREKKKAELVQHFKENADDLDGILTFDMIYDGRWLNVGTSLKKAKEEIDDRIEKFRADINTIANHVEEKYRLAVKSHYIRTMDISKALAEGSRLAELDRRMEEEARRKEEEEARRLAEEKAKAEEVEAESKQEVAPEVPIPEEDATEDVAKDPFVAAKEKQYKASFTVYGTKEQIMALKQYMVENNIKFGKVE